MSTPGFAVVAAPGWRGVGGAVRCAAWFALSVQRVLDAVYRSAATGREVTLD